MTFKDLQELKDFKEILESKVWPAYQEIEDPKEIEGQLGLKETEDLKDFRENVALKEIEDFKDLKEIEDR